MNRTTWLIALGVGTAAAVALFQTAAADNKAEVPPTFDAGEMLGGHSLSGVNYMIDPVARNDGYLNLFTVTVDGETYRVRGNALMRERLDELAALERMDDIKRTEVFKNAATEGVKTPFRTFSNLVTSPVETTKSIGSGVGTFFRSLGHSMFGSPSEQESGAIRTALGFDEAKRQFAFGFGIDPYTSFPPVRERLDEISWAATGGSMTVSAAFGAIDAPAGRALSGTKLAGGMAKLIAEKTPAELKRINAGKLSAMYVNDDIAALFLEHPKFSPTQKTVLVEAMARTGVSQRQAFIERTLLVQSEDEAYFMRRWAEALMGYHQQVTPLSRIVRVGNAPFGQRVDGVLVGVFPIDHLAWTGEIAWRHATNMQDLTNIDGVTGGEIWFEGSISPAARTALEEQDWIVRENAGKQLGLN